MWGSKQENNMAGHVETLDLARFGVDSNNGFLPATEPIASFGSSVPSYLQTLEEVERNLPELLENGQLRDHLSDLKTPSEGLFDTLTERELYYLYSITGFLANAVIHGSDAPDADTIPAGIAIPLYEATSRLGCTSVLSYDAYVLHNWTRTDSQGGMIPRDPRDIQPITTFTGLDDERWFIAIHVAIESAAGPAIAAIGDVQQGILEDDPTRISRALRVMDDSICDVTEIMKRMPENNDPEVYGQGFRPYLGSLTEVTFEGVSELDGPQSFRGASGAQSSLFPALDAALGIDHGDNPLVNHLRTLRKDMPPAHREFIETIEEGPNLYGYVENADANGTYNDLRVTYNECIDRMITFRKRHIEVVERYLTNKLDSSEGTGGTPYNRYLGTFTDDTQQCKLSS
jgi:indoleamine 2,3-dioxygenase